MKTRGESIRDVSHRSNRRFLICDDIPAPGYIAAQGVCVCMPSDQKKMGGGNQVTEKSWPAFTHSYLKYTTIIERAPVYLSSASQAISDFLGRSRKWGERLK